LPSLYAIGIAGLPIATATKGHKSGRAVLEDLVNLNGGQAFFTTDVRKLEGISTRIERISETSTYLDTFLQIGRKTESGESCASN
jgi:hypothetical protein